MTLKDILTSGNNDIKNDPKIEMINIKSENKIWIEPNGIYVRFDKGGQFEFSTFKL